MGYLIPSGRLSPEKNVEKDKEKLKLTPIPFKNKILISGEEERKKIKEAQKSAVLMRRVEYTHYIKKNKSKNNIDSNAINLNDKVYILKGAIIIIEDWWKNIKYRRKIMKSRKFKNGRNIYDKNSELDRKTKTININIEPNEIKSEKLLIIILFIKGQEKGQVNPKLKVLILLIIPIILKKLVQILILLNLAIIISINQLN